MSQFDEETSLPEPLVEAMLLDSAQGTAPPAEVAARIKHRVLARVAGEGAQAPLVEILRADGWKPFVPGAEMKVLHDDGTTMSWLVRLAPGGRLPPHDHDAGPEECLMIEGELIVNGVRYGAGDYSIAARGSRHDEVRSETGALFFLRSPSWRAHRQHGVT
ncbi:MAG TPA: cupin domain-containing protein [Burkholderiaceae bacterium]|nr:cupin domain-containing protein [Burkholderiaceae bacterium]